ncbi:hypothetical protein DPMN_179053 [Dreissena polymorpha]|uniref:Transposase n=1 Tax=Dreissena polymorpha TaxID=45954 RepID=A0A9D4IKF3_DREPO|nr:hypothetical protein DPMN_179053 [Dreissena polymorpha]
METKLNDCKKELGFAELVQFISCTLHVVHNAFKNGIYVYGEDAEQLAVDIFQWFKSHTCQREDFQETLAELGLGDKMFVRHVKCRCLTLVPALQRILRNWKAVCKYYITDLPAMSKNNHTESNLRKNIILKMCI